MATFAVAPAPVVGKRSRFILSGNRISESVFAAERGLLPTMTMTGEGISKIMKWKHGTGRPTYFLGRHTGDPCRYEWIYSAHDGAHALESRSPSSDPLGFGAAYPRPRKTGLWLTLPTKLVSQM